MRRLLPSVTSVLLCAMALAAPPESARKDTGTPWLGEEMPLPLAVRTPVDLALKAVAERQYLEFNLLASGKLAWDRGDFATAASKWESLLRLANLDPEIDRTVRPLAQEARQRAGGVKPMLPPPPPPSPAVAGNAGSAASRGASSRVAVSGTVSGGGSLGPGGTVLWLKRADGATPRPSAGPTRVMNQANKTFVPRILPITVGSKVDFKNQDTIFHNVFSLSKPNAFDAGLYKSGASYPRTFNAPGPVQVLCNIHASMIGYVVVVDTPYYAQADASGAFSIKNVPPADYVLEVWHENASSISRTKLSVGRDGMKGLAVTVAPDRRPTTFVPDKYGKPRQAQLGY